MTIFGALPLKSDSLFAVSAVVPVKLLLRCRFARV